MSRKPLDRVVSVLATAILVFAVCFAVFAVAVTLSSGGRQASLLGWKPYIVLSDSMQPEFGVGDIAVSREVDPATLEPGDIVTFASANPDANGEVLTHKIRAIVEYEGSPAFVTYGTATGDDDEYPVPFDRVVGQYRFSIPKAGYAFEFFKSPLGYVALVLVPYSILIGFQVRGFLRLIKANRSQQAEALAAERRKADELRAELERLRSAGVARVPVASAAKPAAAPVVAPSSIPEVIPVPRTKVGKHARVSGSGSAAVVRDRSEARSASAMPAMHRTQPAADAACEPARRVSAARGRHARIDNASSAFAVPAERADAPKRGRHAR